MLKYSKKDIYKQINYKLKQGIFTQYGIGTDKETYKRTKMIFKNKNINNPDFKIFRNINEHFPKRNVVDMKSVQNGNEISLQTYSYPAYYQQKEQQNQKCKGLIYIFHGMHDQSVKSLHIAKAFSNMGYTVYSFDHKGHGESQGIRGYVSSIEDHLQDCNNFIKASSQKYEQGIPKFLLGLSMGGMTTYLLSHQNSNVYNGAIMFAPALVPIHNKIDQNLAHFLARIIPSVPFLPPNIYASNSIKQISEILEKEKYSNKGIFLKPGTASTMFKGMEMCNSSFHKYEQSFLIIQGGVDKLVDPLGAKLLMKQSPSKDKQILWYDEMWHDIWHEPEIEEIIPQVIKWVVRRT